MNKTGELYLKKMRGGNKTFYMSEKTAQLFEQVFPDDRISDAVRWMLLYAIETKDTKCETCKNIGSECCAVQKYQIFCQYYQGNNK